jgi:hypothetical protein
MIAPPVTQKVFWSPTLSQNEAKIWNVCFKITENAQTTSAHLITIYFHVWEVLSRSEIGLLIFFAFNDDNEKETSFVGNIV